MSCNKLPVPTNKPFCYWMGPTGPLGPTGPTGPSGSNTTVYGGIYQSAVQFITFPSLNTYVQVQLQQALPSNGVTPNADNTLTIMSAGVYEIQYNILINTNKPVDLGVAVRQNENILPTTRGSQTLAIDSATTISYDGRLSGTSIVSLNAGDRLDLAIQVLNTLPADLTAIINGNVNATLTVKKLSDPI